MVSCWDACGESRGKPTRTRLSRTQWKLVQARCGPHKPLEPLVKRMRKRGVRRVLVTTPEGKLIGILREEDAERLLTDPGVVEVWQDCEGCPGQWKAILKSAV